MSFENNPADDRYQLDQCIDEIKSLQSQIATLTAERDEARKGENTQCTIRYMMQDEIDALKAELAALKSAPAMAEVEELRAKWESAPDIEAMNNLAREMLFVLRRSIASRQEVVGLLDHILSRIITVRRENTPEWMEWIVEEINKVNEAIGDPDRVALSLGNIVIVKGCPEIVEGNHA